MRNYVFPRNRKELDDMLVSAFDMGMQCAYSVEHTEKSSDEQVLKNRFRAYIRGECDDMASIVNGERTYIERF